MKNYTQAPLPFQGQKRRFLNDFKAALQQAPEDTIFVDLFGGSGLLSHTAKQAKPSAKVVYNDFDQYSKRIANIEQTNKVLADIRHIVQGCEKDKKIPEGTKAIILSRIKREKGFVDYITLSSSLLFSMKYVTCFAELEKQTFYNTIRLSDYVATGYLQGVELVQEDYKTLFKKYADQPNVIFLIDPPYLSTDSSTYSSDGYWKLADYLDVLDTLKTGNYFYFTSNKSHVVELCEWVSSKTGGRNPFEGAYCTKVSVQMNYSSTYTDIMLHKFN